LTIEMLLFGQLGTGDFIMREAAYKSTELLFGLRALNTQT